MIPQAEVDRLTQQIHGNKFNPERTQFTQEGDKADFTTPPREATDLSDTDGLLRERGLDPEEWDIQSLRVNEWEGPGAEGSINTFHQLRVNVVKKPSFILQPAFEPDGYVAPEKTGQRDPDQGKLVVFVGDQQAPHHDERLHGLFLQWLEDNEPDEGILMGDTVDFPDISRHAPNPEWDATVQECINSGYLLLRDYVQSSDQTKWTKLVGNHDERIRNRLLNYNTGLFGLRQADIPGDDPEPSVWCPSHLLRLRALDIDYVQPNGGYTHAQVKLGRRLAARHGWIAKKGSGASALSTLEHLGFSVVVGHTHRQSLVHKTTHDIDGSPSTLAAAETGCMCKITDGLGYAVAPDWQNGFATATIWPDGTFKLDLATYAGGALYWRNQRYR